MTTGTFASTSLPGSLRAELLGLPFHAFALCISRLLGKLGYTQVQLAGRTDWKGRNQHGGGSGFDLTAVAPVTLSNAGSASGRRVVISLKQFQPDQKIYQRTLDELRGACLRVGASEALLITMASISPTVRVSQAAPLAPVTVVDGDRLLALMIEHCVGVIEVDGYLKLDTVLIANLVRESTGNGRADCHENSPAKRTTVGNPAPSLRVIVHVEPLAQTGTGLTQVKKCSGKEPSC